MPPAIYRSGEDPTPKSAPNQPAERNTGEKFKLQNSEVGMGGEYAITIVIVMIKEKWDCSPATTERTEVAWGCLACFLKRRQQRRVGVLERSRRMSAAKNAASENGADEKRHRRKIGAGEKCCRRNMRRKMLPAKFPATNAQTKLPWNSTSVRNKF